MLSLDRTLFGRASGLSYADTPHGLFVVHVKQAICVDILSVQWKTRGVTSREVLLSKASLSLHSIKLMHVFNGGLVEETVALSVLKVTML